MLTNLVRVVRFCACTAGGLLPLLTSFQRHCIREYPAEEHRSLQWRAPACAFCVFVTASAGARGLVVVRRIGLCLGFLAAAAAASRWVSTLCLSLYVLFAYLDWIRAWSNYYLILNPQSHVTRRGIELEALRAMPSNSPHECSPQ